MKLFVILALLLTLTACDVPFVPAHLNAENARQAIAASALPSFPSDHFPLTNIVQSTPIP